MKLNNHQSGIKKPSRAEMAFNGGEPKKNVNSIKKPSRVAKKSTGGKAPRSPDVPASPYVPVESEGGKNKKPHKWRPGTVALREIRRYQKQAAKKEALLIPKVPFVRLVREITHELSPNGDTRWAKEALGSLQEASEMFLTEVFDISNLCAIHRNRVTVMNKDVKFCNILRKKFKGEHVEYAKPQVQPEVATD